MPLIAQICMVIVTIAVAVFAVMGIRLMAQTNKLIVSANVSLAEVPTLLEEVKRTSARVEELLAAFASISESARVGVSQFENVATRAGGLASTLLNEVERPLAQAVGIARSIRFGANYLVQRWKSRTGDRSQPAPGDEHVGEQRWLDDGGVPVGSSGRSRPGADFRAHGR